MATSVTLDEFRSWLNSMPARSLIGYREAAQSCPVAHYLNHKGESVLDVAANHWIDGEHETHELPEWVELFIAAVDTGQYEGYINESINREECLYILDRISA